MRKFVVVTVSLLLLTNVWLLLLGPEAQLLVYGSQETQETQETQPQPKLSPDFLYTYHVVKVGENPASICRRYGMDVPELFRLNDLTKPSDIYPGDLLKVHYNRNLIPRPRKGAGEEASALFVLSLIISEYDKDTLTVAKGISGKSPDFSFFHGYAPPGVPRFQA